MGIANAKIICIDENDEENGYQIMADEDSLILVLEYCNGGNLSECLERIRTGKERFDEWTLLGNVILEH